MTDQNLDQQYSLLFSVRRSVRYHMRRCRFFDRLNMTTSAMAVIFGSATMAALLAQADQRYAITAAAIVTIFAAADLVIGSARMARLHTDLAKRFIVLEQAVQKPNKPTANQITTWNSSRLDIEAEEPPVLRALDSICHNELLRAMGIKKGAVTITWYQRLFAQLLDLRDHTITATQTN